MLHINPINLFADLIINIVPSGYVSCTPEGYIGCDTDQCGCDGCANTSESCFQWDICYYSDARCNTSVLGGDSSPGDAKCFTIQNDICNCLDVAQGKTDADMHKCLSCDVGPPEDNCTIADTCDSAFGGTYDWVSCGMPDWTCTCGMSDPAPYGPDNTL